MRVSYNQTFLQAVNQMLALQRNAADLQLQIATGLRVTQPADDPVAAASVLQINDRLSALAQFNRNIGRAEEQLTLYDDVLGSVSDVLQRVRELMLQGRNETLGLGDRESIAIEVGEQLDALAHLGNTRNAAGEYIFSGASIDIPSFTVTAAAVVAYNGDQVVRQLQISESRLIAEGFTGSEAFLEIRNGNGDFVAELPPAGNTGTAQISENFVLDPTAYQAHDFRISFTGPTTFDVINDTTGATVLVAQPYVDGSAITFSGMSVTVFGVPATGDEFLLGPSQNQSIFTTMDEVVQALQIDQIDAAATAAFGFDMDRAIEDVDRALDRVLELRATAGARLNSMQAQTDSNAAMDLQLQSLRSKLQDVDLTEAISLLVQQTTALEAAQLAFVRVQGLSLFNFL